MSTRSPVALVENAWTLIYDTAVTGDFVGMASTSSQFGVALAIAGAPPAGNFLGSFFGLQQAISLSKSAGDKLYARPLAGRGSVTLDSGMLAGAMPVGLFAGTRAITVQNYIEANVKNGVQYEISANVAALGIGANIDTIFTTGAKPVVIKSRIVKFNGTSLATRVYRAPTFTGGTIAPYFNLNDRNPVTGSVVVRSGATVSAPGVEFGAPTFDIGSDGQGNSSLSTYAVTGIERLLAPNTTYLQRVTNDSPAIQRVSTYLTWFEGDTDLPVGG